MIAKQSNPPASTEEQEDILKRVKDRPKYKKLGKEEQRVFRMLCSFQQEGEIKKYRSALLLMSI